MDRGAWWATVHGVAKSPMQLKWLACILEIVKPEGTGPDLDVCKSWALRETAGERCSRSDGRTRLELGWGCGEGGT